MRRNPAATPILHLRPGYSLRGGASAGGWGQQPCEGQRKGSFAALLRLRARGLQLRVPAGHRPRVTVTSSCLVRNTLGFEGALFLSDMTDLVGKLLFLHPYYALFFLPPPKIMLPSYHFLLKNAKPEAHRILVAGREKEEIICSCYFVEKVSLIETLQAGGDCFWVSRQPQVSCSGEVGGSPARPHALHPG